MTALQQQLDDLTAQFADKIPDKAKALMKKINSDLTLELTTRNALKVGDKLPAFSLKNQDGEIVSSDALLQDRPLIISFFRGVWCPYCNIEVQALEKYAQQFRNAGATIVVISPQAQSSARRSVDENNTSFDVLSDTGNAYADLLGLRFTLPDELKKLYQGFGINLPEHNGDDSWSLPFPARFVITPDSTVIAADINPDYTQRPDPSETLAILKQIKAG